MTVRESVAADLFYIIFFLWPLAIAIAVVTSWLGGIELEVLPSLAWVTGGACAGRLWTMFFRK